MGHIKLTFEVIPWMIPLLMTIQLACCVTATNLTGKQALKPQFKFFNTCALKRLVEDADESRIRSFWFKLLRPIIKERIPGSTGSKEVQQHIVDRIGELPNKVWGIERDAFESNTPLGRIDFTNIIVTQQPEKARKLVLACHFDSKVLDAGQHFLAATDSAVPCAILLDIAVSLNEYLANTAKISKDVSLKLVFFDGEEAFKHWTDTDSLYGSRHLAHDWKSMKDGVDNKKSLLETIEAFILLDLVGAEGMQFWDFYPQDTTHLFDKLQKIEQELRSQNLLHTKDLMFKSERPWGSGVQDDHVPFMLEGVRILHLIAYPFPSVWHKVNDDEEHLDWKSVDNFNRIFRVFISQYLQLPISGKSCKK